MAISCQKDNVSVCKAEDVSVTVFKDASFEGASQTFGIGAYFIDDLDVVGNDQISSIRVSSETCVKVTLCEHANPNKTGVCIEYYSDEVLIDGLNDMVSYVKVEMR